MKKKILLSSSVLFLMVLSFMTSCSSDDDNENDISYTSEEIVQILTGKWEIYGHVSVSGDTDKEIDTDFTGTIEFKADLSYSAKSSAITTGGITNSATGETYTYNVDIQDFLSGTPYKYTILRKNGKYYIYFGSSNNPDSSFEIVSLTKKSFKLMGEVDKAWGSRDELHYAHYRITIVSD